MSPLDSSDIELITVMDFSGNDTHRYYGDMLVSNPPVKGGAKGHDR